LAVTKEGSVCQLMLHSLSREMVGTRLQCRVEPPLLQPVIREVSLKLFRKLTLFIQLHTYYLDLRRRLRTNLRSLAMANATL
jgi:hypothetical protein